MPLPKAVAAGVCIAVLGAQLLASSPLSRGGSDWYWPFLRYPMYSKAHGRTDSLLVPELRAARCGDTTFNSTLSPDSLGIPPAQLIALLTTIGRATDATAGRSAEAKLGRAVDAQFPGRFCSASAWLRVVNVADTSTYVLRAPMRRVASWAIDPAGHE